MSTRQIAQELRDYVAARTYLPKGLQDIVLRLMSSFGEAQAPVGDDLGILPGPGFYVWTNDAADVWEVPGPVRSIATHGEGVVDIESVDGSRAILPVEMIHSLPIRFHRVHKQGTTARMIVFLK